MLWLLDVVAALMEVSLGALSVAVHVNNPFNGLIATMAAALWLLAVVLLLLLVLKYVARPRSPWWSQAVLVCQLVAFAFFVIGGIVMNATVLTAWRIDHLHYNKIFLVFFTLIVVIVGYTTLPLPKHMLTTMSASDQSSSDDSDKLSLAITPDLEKQHQQQKHSRQHQQHQNHQTRMALAATQLRQPVPIPLPPTTNPLGSNYNNIDDYEVEPGFDIYLPLDRRHASGDTDYDRYNSLFDLGIPDRHSPHHTLPGQQRQARPTTNLAALPMLPHNWSLPLSNTSPMLLPPSSNLSHLPIRKMLSHTAKHGHLNLVLTLKGYLTGKTKHHKKLSLVPTTHSYNSFGSLLTLYGGISGVGGGGGHIGKKAPAPPLPLAVLAPPGGISYHHMVHHSDSTTSRGTTLASDLIEFWDDDNLPLPLLSHLPVPLELQWAPGGNNDSLRILLLPSQVIGEYDKEKWDTIKALNGAAAVARLSLKQLRPVLTNASRNST